MSASRAILVGLKEVSPEAYGGWDGKNGCAGCELDVDNVAQILEPLGYEIQTLKTAEATKASILNALNAASRELEGGDTLVFYYAGHGGQQPDRNGDESDGHDETLIVYDGEIIDDQLNEIWCKFQPDVHIVMLSDSCNSGTNYRAMADVRTPTPIVPLDKRASKAMMAQMFHMGGCRDGFTSAGYQSGGEFTIGLVNVWSSGQFQGTYEDLYNTIVQGITSGQRPQFNWYGNVSEEFRNAPAFRVMNGQLPSPAPPSPAVTGMDKHGNRDLSDDSRRLLIEAYLKLLETVGASEPSGTRAVTDRHLVCVHGISTHTRGYSNKWWNALKAHTAVFGDGRLDDTRHEVLWSNLVNSRDVRDPRAVNELKLRIQDVIEDRQRQQVAVVGPALGDRTMAETRGADFAWDDFLIYMTNPVKRQQIIDRFTDVVRPLLQGEARIDIISHSWGTVVAYEGLRAMESEGTLTGEVANFFTVGSALSIPPVRGALRPANKDGRRPQQVRNWVNLDAQGDLVGGSLADRFEVDVEKLELIPVGCKKNLGGLGWFSLKCAHGSYFEETNLQVNQKIFGHFING